jgi:predicted PurR-regulated permease PerM
MRLSEEKLTRMMKMMVIVTLVLLSLFIFSQFTGLIGAVRGTFKSVVTPFLVAFFINFLIYPIVVYLEDKGLRPRWLIVALIFAVILGIFVVVFTILTPIIVDQLIELIDIRIPALYQGILDSIQSLNLDNELVDEIITSTQAGIKSTALKAVTGLTTSIPKIFSGIMTVVLIPIILFYMLKDRNKIGEGFYKVVPVSFREHFVVLVKRINDTIGLYLRGQFIIMFGIGSIATLGYKLIGLDYAIVFGVVVGLTNIIPYVGATIAAIVPVTYALLAKDAAPWYLVLVLNLSFQFVEGNILQPVIMSKQLDMHPLIILAAILGFGSLLGVVGVIFAVPIAGIIKVCILYYKEVKDKRELEGNLI